MNFLQFICLHGIVHPVLTVTLGFFFCCYFDSIRHLADHLLTIEFTGWSGND